MKITYKGDYALKAVLDLALHYDKSLITINEVAKRIDAPIKFLEQVFLDLKRGGFVESKRGKIGGYRLARLPKDIKLGEVVRFIDGPIEPVSCVEDGYAACADVYKCVFRKVWQQVYQATSDIIDNITFEDLVVKAGKDQGLLSYNI